MLRLQLWLSVFLCIVWLLSGVLGEPQCKTWFGRPEFQSCKSLLFGTRESGRLVILTEGIDRIDRIDHLFHTRPEYVQARPQGVTALQYRWMLRLPQPSYPNLWMIQNPTLDAPTASRYGPVPWSNGGFCICSSSKETDCSMSDADGCKIMLLPIKKPDGDFAYDTGKFKPIAEVGGRINSDCVRPVAAGGRGLGGMERAGKSSCIQTRQVSLLMWYYTRRYQQPNGPSALSTGLRIR